MFTPLLSCPIGIALCVRWTTCLALSDGMSSEREHVTATFRASIHRQSSVFSVNLSLLLKWVSGRSHLPSQKCYLLNFANSMCQIAYFSGISIRGRDRTLKTPHNLSLDEPEFSYSSSFSPSSCSLPRSTHEKNVYDPNCWVEHEALNMRHT